MGRLGSTVAMSAICCFVFRNCQSVILYITAERDYSRRRQAGAQVPEPVVTHLFTWLHVHPIRALRHPNDSLAG